MQMSIRSRFLDQYISTIRVGRSLARHKWKFPRVFFINNHVNLSHCETVRYDYDFIIRFIINSVPPPPPPTHTHTHTLTHRYHHHYHHHTHLHTDTITITTTTTHPQPPYTQPPCTHAYVIPPWDTSTPPLHRGVSDNYLRSWPRDSDWKLQLQNCLDIDLINANNKLVVVLQRIIMIFVTHVFCNEKLVNHKTNILV